MVSQQLARTGYGPLKPCPSLVQVRKGHVCSDRVASIRTVSSEANYELLLQSGNYQRAGIDGQLGERDPIGHAPVCSAASQDLGESQTPPPARNAL